MDWEKIAMQYRADAERYQKEAEEAKVEFNELESQSHQLEVELDMELSRTNEALIKRNKEVANLTQERDKYKDEAGRLRTEKYELDNKLTKELMGLKAEKERLVGEVCRLEQKNDDLERELRITSESLKDTEKKFNEELEMRAILTTELDSKEELKDRCQRLEDEIRDLKLDYSIKNAKLSNRPFSAVQNASSPLVTNGRYTAHEDITNGNKNFRKMDQSQLPHSFVHSKNGFLTHDDSDCASEVTKKKCVGGIYSNDIGSRVNALPRSLASSVSPVIANLLDAIQTLENKLLLLHPDRRVGLDSALSNGTNR